MSFLDALYGAGKLSAQQREAILKGANPEQFGLNTYDLFWLAIGSPQRIPSIYVGTGAVDDAAFACLAGARSFLQTQLDELRAALAPVLPSADVLPGYSTAITNAALKAGAVIKRVRGGNITLASGGSVGDSDGTCGVSLAAAQGERAKFYPSGTRAPISGLPVGNVFRSNTGTLTLEPVSGEYTVAMGFSDGEGVDVLIIPREFPA
jgi:hypothetical protein